MAILDSDEWIKTLVASGIWRKGPPVKCETCPAMIRFVNASTCWDCEFKKKYRHECTGCGALIPKHRKLCLECRSKAITGDNAIGLIAI